MSGAGAAGPTAHWCALIGSIDAPAPSETYASIPQPRFVRNLAADIFEHHGTLVDLITIPETLNRTMPAKWK
jgi:hypothetical protein